MKTETFDLVFHNSENSNDCGFSFTSIEEARLEVKLGTNEYFNTYNDGTVAIISSITGEVERYSCDNREII